MSNKAVIYARFSSHSQNEQTIDTQVDICTSYAKKNNLYISGGSDYHGDKKTNNDIAIGNGTLKMSKEYIEEWAELINNE